MRVLGYTVIRNEAHRYLQACLEWHKDVLDGIAVYDDRSVDAGPEIAREAGCAVKVRSDLVPSFLEHEGVFRAAAWAWMEEALEPDDGDWILALDADEFLVSNAQLAKTVREVTRRAVAKNLPAVMLTIPEVFDTSDGIRTRIDGYWNTIRAPRLFQYQRHAQFRPKKMGCGSEPLYVSQGPFEVTSELHLLHFGYADDADRREKYARYRSLAAHGHANSHVDSILDEPTLQTWNGPMPEVWRGLNGC